MPTAHWQAANRLLLAMTLLASACSHSTKPMRPLGGSPHATAVADPLAHTGIPACDAYLASYMSCHRAAGIYDPAELQSHYVAMRDDLVASSHDPRVLPVLAGRCVVLGNQLSSALKGRSCVVTTPPASSTH